MKFLGSKGTAVQRISPGDGHYFFGYYDLQPYNLSQDLYLTHKTDFRNRLQWRQDVAEVGFIDLSTGCYEKLSDTRAWNFQQGAMLQWNPRSADREVIFNDFIDGAFCGVVMDIHSGKKRFLDRPVANVSRDGRFALSINMARLYDFRPGYGYAAKPDPFYYKKHPKDDGVFLIDMETGKSRLILSLEEIWEFCGSFFGDDKKINVNHITFNPSANRFLMLVRNFAPQGTRHDTALITANRDGSDLYLLSGFGVQSHYWWINDEEVLIYSDGKELDCSLGWGNNYILKDMTHEGCIQADGFFEGDNHMSFSPDGRLMITDSYPNETRHQVLKLYNPLVDTCVDLGYFHSMENCCTDVRCDLHPRWNRTSDGITFDSTHEGFRGIYRIDLPSTVVDSLLRDNVNRKE